MYLRFPAFRLRLHLLALPTFFLLLWVEGLFPALILILTALLHEAGHLLAIKLTRVPLTGIDLEPMGITLHYNETACPFRTSALITFAGPAANLLCGLLSLFFLTLFRLPFADVPGFFCFCNLFLAFLNLLPLTRLDGGALLHTLLLTRFPPETCDRVSAAVSAIFTLLLTASILYFGIRYHFPPWMLLLSAVFLTRMQ